MTEDAETYSQAEIVRLLKRLDGNVTALSSDVRRQEQNYVTRAEWSLFKEGNDRELKQIKEATAPVRVSPWMVAGFVVSAVVGAGSLIALVITLIQATR